MPEWRTETVEDCLLRLPLRAAKLQTQDYRSAGLYPIIDQGQALIAGWTDDDSGLISADLPVVVFGDHTRVFKFVDFPFVRGADGTQILKPKAGIDPLYFYYACRAIDLPSRGYNRHFKALKEREISVPPDEEQRCIAKSLKLLDETLSLQDAELQAAEKCKRAAMRALFTRGLRGEAPKETEIGPVPQSWGVVSLSSLGRIGSGTTPNRTKPEFWQGGSIPWITSGRMYEREIMGSDESVTSIAIENSSLPMLEPGAVLIAIVGQGKTLGHCAILGVEATISRHVGYVQPDKGLIVPEYLRGFLESQYDWLRQLASGNGSTRAALTGAILKSLQVPLPPTLDQQREIVAVLDSIDRKIDLHRRKRAVLDNLFRALLHKLMTGDIRVADLDLSALSPKPAAQAAA
jgi:type I restriction enzyme S subunit